MGQDELSKHYDGLRQAQLDQLMAKFDEMDNGSGLPTKKKAPAQKKVTVQTNIGKKSVAAPKNIVPEMNQYADEEELQGEGQLVCNFCNATDPNWTDDALDVHYWRDCPMLTTCWECEQVIEIKQLEEHLLEECPHKQKYKYDP